MISRCFARSGPQSEQGSERHPGIEEEGVVAGRIVVHVEAVKIVGSPEELQLARIRDAELGVEPGIE
jgi:hypothetical protein